ncbi:MAG: hypothetical protein LN563_02625 [Rickettsia endosymbiont of Platyusa sonomae]|nr:hypothetical protein [Rickettsia endosymbiont of Platyusa sonomae]
MKTIIKLVVAILSLLLFNTTIANTDKSLNKEINNKHGVWQEGIIDDNNLTSNSQLHSTENYYNKGTAFEKLEKYYEAIVIS